MPDRSTPATTPAIAAINHERAESVGDTLCARWAAIAGEGVELPFPPGDLRWADLVQAVLRHSREDEQAERPEPTEWR